MRQRIAETAGPWQDTLNVRISFVRFDAIEKATAG